MEFHKINYAVIEECLSASESKEAIFNIFKTSATNILDSEIKVIKSDELPATLKQLPTTLSDDVCFH